jgi:hypothetical protein
MRNGIDSALHVLSLPLDIPNFHNSSRFFTHSMSTGATGPLPRTVGTNTNNERNMRTRAHGTNRRETTTKKMDAFRDLTLKHEVLKICMI